MTMIFNASVAQGFRDPALPEAAQGFPPCGRTGRPPVARPVINGSPHLHMEWTDRRLRQEFVQRARYNPANADRQWGIERLVKKIAKDAHASTKREEIWTFIEVNYGEYCHESALGESRPFWEVHDTESHISTSEHKLLNSSR
jgi:hypothetical protein